MRKTAWIASLIFGFTAFEATAALMSAGPGQESPRQVGDSAFEFGIWDQQGRFIETDEVPLRVGTVYGWRLRAAADMPVAWREEFTLPEAPRSWGGGGSRVSADGRTAVTEGREAAVSEFPEAPVAGFGEAGGWLDHQWSVIDGDPAGEATIRVTVEGGALVHEFHIRFR
jgi:hypothetical protein